MNSKDLIKYGLIALGAYLIWKYIEDNGGLSNVLGTATGTSTGAGAIPASCGSNQTLQIQQLASLGITLSAAQQQQICGATSINLTSVLTPAQQAIFNAAAIAAASKFPATTPPATNTAYVPPAGSTTTVQPGTSTPAIVQGQVLTLAQASGEPDNLNADQWCYYYAQVTGKSCPDPGAISPAAYAAANLVDRTSLTDINTWWNLMANNGGLSGMGAFSIPMGTPHWMVM